MVSAGRLGAIECPDRRSAAAGCAVNVSAKLCRIRNVINAAIEKIGVLTPHHDLFEFFEFLIFSDIYQTQGVDIILVAAYIYLHSKATGCRPGQARYQSRVPQATGCLEPVAPAGPCIVVPGRRLLRRPRSRPSEVRDAPPSQSRRREESRRRRPLRRLPPDLLSGRSGVRAARTGRIIAAAARPQEPTQAHPRSDGLYRYPDS